VLDNTLKPERVEERQEKKRGAVEDTTFKAGGGGQKFTAMNVPRQCPFVLPSLASKRKPIFDGQLSLLCPHASSTCCRNYNRVATLNFHVDTRL
jgi:hypothetical protein